MTGRRVFVEPARPIDHYTRLWPAGSDERHSDSPLFHAAVSPLRAAALAVLWATSTPGRLAVALGLAVLLAAVLVVVV